MGEAQQFGDVEDLDATAGHRDHAVVLQAGEAAADGFQGEAEKARDVLATHRQLEQTIGLADVAITLAETVQKQRDALVRLAADEDAEMVLVAIDALADHTEQLLLQAGYLPGDLGQKVVGHLADGGGGQRNAFATMMAAAERIEADELARQVEAEHLFFAVLADADRLERAIAGDEDRGQRIAKTEQAFAAGHGPTTLDDLVEPLQLFRADAAGQADLADGAVGAAPAQLDQIEDGGIAHCPLVCHGPARSRIRLRSNALPGKGGATGHGKAIGGLRVAGLESGPPQPLYCPDCAAVAGRPAIMICFPGEFVRNYDLDFLKRFSMVIAFLVALTLGLILFAAYLHHELPPQANPVEVKRTEARIAPTGQVYAGASGEAAKAAADEAAKAAAASQVAYGGTMDGSVIYGNLCAGCHTSGAGGAPKLDAAGMGARAGQGKDTLYKHAIEGFTGSAGVMPAKGGNPALTDDQVKAAVDWMLDQV